MGDELRFDGRVAIITGAGNGLGRSHALLLASRGARVVVNDLGGSAHGEGKSSAAADKVVAEIKAAGGEAVANYDSVEDGDKIVQCAMDAFGRVDVVVNNAGILRDTSFQKMSQADWDLIYRVHVLGAFRVTHAAWPHMRDQGYGRVVFTTSAAGIYGNFGQANYSMAKLGLVGLSNTLALEGKKKNVFANAIAPIAGSRMTETVLPKELIEALRPEFVSPLVAYLCHESCEENGGLFEVGGGFVGKLRWERTKGHAFKLSRRLSIEDVARTWGKITDFSEADHPADITAAMQPVLGNLDSARSRGGNEFIDVDQALAHKYPDVTSTYDERDLALYALGVGAAKDPLDEKELQYVYELHRDGFQPLPTFAVTQGINAILKLGQAPGLNFGFERILHGEQYTELKRPLAPKAKLTHRGRVKDIFDKGKHALVVTELRSFDESGDEVIYNETTMLVRGAGGWGGDRGPSADVNVPPARDPDAVVEEQIADNQALLYRLSGDWNPLHADPSFAANFGFKRPILHGLCTFGYAARHVIKHFMGGDPRRFKSIRVRFADTVFPGETLRTEMWKESDGRVVFRCKVKERDAVVLSNAAIEIYDRVPSEKPAAKPASAPAAAASSAPAAAASSAAPGAASGPIEPTSADVFAVIEHHVKSNPGLAAKVGTVYQFKLTGPDSAWVLDLKNGSGEVKQGTADKPDCTLELADSDWVAMASGKADPQKLYFGGKLKISGNVMASQKLEFLKKMDPKVALEVVAKRRGLAGTAVPAGTAADVKPSQSEASGGAPTSADVFAVIEHYVKNHPELAGKVGTVYQFKLTAPESAWVLDLKNGAGSVKQGTADKPDCTLELADSDWIAMASGKADPQKLYFGGKLKISGNVMASQKLEFLKKIDPKDAAAAVAASRGSAQSAPTASGPAPATTTSKAPALFAALRDRLAKSPALGSEIGAALAFEVTGPASAWVVDLSGPTATVKEGTDPKAAARLALAEEDLEALFAGAQSPRELFMRGKLRVEGDVRLAHKLHLLAERTTA